MIKNVTDFLKEKFSYIIVFCIVFVLYGIIFERSKVIFEKYVLMYIIGIKISDYIPVATDVFIVILSLIFSVFTLFLISFAKRPQNDNYICLILKSNEVSVNYKDYLNFVPTEKTSLYPDFTIATFKKKLLGVAYILISIIPVLDKNYFITCILASIPFIYNIYKNLVDSNKKKVDIQLKITVLVVFLGIFLYSSYNVIFEIYEGTLNSNLTSNAFYKSYKTLSSLGINMMEEKNYKIAIMLDRKNIPVYISLAEYYKKNGQNDKVFETYQNMIKYAPESPFGYYYLGLELKKNKKDTQAQEMFHKTRFLDNDFSEAYFEEAKYYYSKGNYEKAEKTIDLVDITISNYDTRLFELKKEILIQKRKFEEALETFYYAIEKDSITHSFYFEKASVYFNVGSLSGALKNIEKAISLSPNEKKYYYFKGQILLALNRPANAMNSFEKAIVIDSKYKESLVGLELARLMIGQKNMAYSNILKLNEKYKVFDVQSLYYMAQVAKEAGYLDFAITTIDKALLKSPEEPLFMAFKSLILMEAGDYENARELVRNSFKKESSNYLAHFALGNYFLFTGNYKESAKSFSKSTKFNPYFSRGYVCLALANYKANDFNEVKDNMDYAKMLNPNDYFSYLINSTILQEQGMSSLATIERQIAIKKQNG